MNGFFLTTAGLGTAMIRQCESAELEKIYEVINEAAATYKGVIPADCWKEPYMCQSENFSCRTFLGAQIFI